MSTLSCWGQFNEVMLTYFRQIILLLCQYVGHSPWVLDWTGHLRTPYVMFKFPTRIFYGGVPGFAIGCPYGVWCRGLTTWLLYVGPLFGNLVENDSRFVCLNLIFMFQIVLCFLHSRSVLSSYIDVILTLFIELMVRDLNRSIKRFYWLSRCGFLHWSIFLWETTNSVH